MYKVMTIVGTRPEIIKLSLVIAELNKNFDHVLVHTGQNFDYELNEVFFRDLEIRQPDFFLEAAGDNAAQTIANVISKSDALMEKVRPDAILLYGDTNSCLSVISAKRRQIPVFHMEAGNRCFDERVPEEINRKIVDHLSDINMPLTEHARRYLIDEGIRPETIIKTGSCMKEVLDYFKNKIETSDVLERLDLEPSYYFVVSAHREENVDSVEDLEELLRSLNDVADTYKRRIIFSLHPRTAKRLATFSSIRLNPLIELMKPLGFLDYIRLQQKSFCVLSDSGTLTEEAAILGFAGVMLRKTHERPEGFDDGVLIMSGLNSPQVLDSIRIATDQVARLSDRVAVKDYDVDQVSRKVVKIIQSYIGFVNRNVWRKGR